MIEGIESVTTSALTLALDAASLRQQAIASNIANAGTQGYVPLRLNFEAQLENARRAIAEGGRTDLFTLSQVRPSIEPALDESGTAPEITLDMEVAEMARNAVHYQALLKGLSRHLALLNMAAGDGRK